MSVRGHLGGLFGQLCAFSLSLALGREADFFKARTDDATAQMVLFKYPPRTGDLVRGETIGILGHFDTTIVADGTSLVVGICCRRVVVGHTQIAASSLRCYRTTCRFVPVVIPHSLGLHSLRSSSCITPRVCWHWQGLEVLTVTNEWVPATPVGQTLTQPP